MSRTVKLLNQKEIIFANHSIIVKFRNKIIESEFKNPGSNLFISLVLLSANEQNLSRAITLHKYYKEIPHIKETIIVGNKFHNKKTLIKYDNIKFIINPKPESPIITSVKYALSCISNFSHYALICPVNKKIVNQEKLFEFIQTATEKELGFSVPIVNQKRFHPIMIKRSEFIKIRKIRKEQGLKYFSKILFKEVQL